MTTTTAFSSNDQIRPNGVTDIAGSFRRLDPVPPIARDLRHDAPARLPASRGPVSDALMRLLDQDPGTAATDADLVWDGPVDDALTDDDLQLALWLVYELHDRGLAGVDDEWENAPSLATLRSLWEHQLLAGLRHAVSARFGPTPDLEPGPLAARHVVAELEDLVAEDGPSMSSWLMKHATVEQFTEFLVHRSIYHLKEADPHSWAIPRLSGAVKAAMITIQMDEYGLGKTGDMHAQLFRDVLRDWELDTGYGSYLDQVPGVTLLSSNVMSMFGLARRWRGAVVGHLAMFEMTSSVPNGRYARAHRRLGGSDMAARFFDEHVVADAVHEQIASHDLAAGLARTEPALAADVVFGARCAALTDELFTAHALTRWERGRSSLYRPMETR